MLTALLIGITIGAWAGPLDRLLSSEVESEFTTYVKRFEYFYGKKVSTSMEFADSPADEDWVGLCYNFSNHVKIDRTYWNTSDDAAKESLIFHELGHCAMDRDHTEKLLSNNCPASLMHPLILSACYKRNKELYIKELFDIDDKI